MEETPDLGFTPDTNFVSTWSISDSDSGGEGCSVPSSQPPAKRRRLGSVTLLETVESVLSSGEVDRAITQFEEGERCSYADLTAMKRLPAVHSGWGPMFAGMVMDKRTAPVYRTFCAADPETVTRELPFLKHPPGSVITFLVRTEEAPGEAPCGMPCMPSVHAGPLVPFHVKARYSSSWVFVWKAAVHYLRAKGLNARLYFVGPNVKRSLDPAVSYVKCVGDIEETVATLYCFE